MSRRPRVFVVNEPIRRDPGPVGGFRREFNLTPAAQWGVIVHLLPAGPLATEYTAIIDLLARGLADYGPDDFLLPVGDMTACTIAASIAARNGEGRYRVLRWNGRAYDPVELDLGEV